MKSKFELLKIKKILSSSALHRDWTKNLTANCSMPEPLNHSDCWDFSYNVGIYSPEHQGIEVLKIKKLTFSGIIQHTNPDA